MQSLAQIIARLEGRRPRVLLVGDLVLDRMIFGTIRRISREAPIPVVQCDGEAAAPGGAANTAANLASLGAEVHLAGLVGDDLRGRELVTLLKELGAGTDLICTRDDQPTTVKTRVLAGGAGTVRQQVARLDEEPKAPPTEATRQRLFRGLIEAAADFDVVALSDYGYGAVDPLLSSQITSAPVVVDSRRQLGRFRGAHTLKPNLSELEGVAGADLHRRDQVIAAAQDLCRRADAGAVLVTLGRDGMQLVERDALRAVPVFGDDEVADVTGAGDSVLAAYTVALAAGLDRFDAARVATVAGAVAVSHHGTHAVTIAELRQALTDA